MSRETIASGAAPNTPKKSPPLDSKSRRHQTWIQNARHGIERSELDAVTAYLATLR